MGQMQPADIREVAVVGLGTMGAGIAELFARSGRSVVAIEASHDALGRGLAMLHASLDKAVARGRLTTTKRRRSSAGSGPRTASRPA